VARDVRGAVIADSGHNIALENPAALTQASSASLPASKPGPGQRILRGRKVRCAFRQDVIGVAS